jgi:hypothetical protein
MIYSYLRAYSAHALTAVTKDARWFSLCVWHPYQSRWLVCYVVELFLPLLKCACLNSKECLCSCVECRWLNCVCPKIYVTDLSLFPVWWPGIKNSPNVAHACRKRRLKWVPNAWGCNWVTLPPGDINTEAWSSRLGVGLTTPPFKKLLLGNLRWPKPQIV